MYMGKMRIFGRSNIRILHI